MTTATNLVEIRPFRDESAQRTLTTLRSLLSSRARTGSKLIPRHFSTNVVVRDSSGYRSHVAGPIAGAIAGAGAGGATGTLVGALIGAGIPENRAAEYERGLRDGGSVLGTRAKDDIHASELERDFTGYGARNVLR